MKRTILTAFQTLDKIQALCSISNCKRELEDRQDTVVTVKAVLEDAEAKQDALNCHQKKYILELKDEFLTLAKKKQLTHQAADNKVSDKMKSFLSRFKFPTHNLSGKVKKVNTKLDAIATKSSKFKIDYKPVMFSRADTYLTLDSRSFTKEKLKLLRQRTCFWSLDLRGQWTCLRSLDLRGLDVENLPESLGNLLHLRFLNLAGCTKLKVLPKAITKLVNLQTLNLDGCVALKELPNKVNKLADLRILNLTHCNALSRMPSDIGMLTSLHTNGVMIGETVILSGTCSFATSNDDDSSSTTTSIISPNGGCMINISHWAKGKLLGKGSFGTVYEGITSEGNFIAVKEVSLLEQGSQGRQSIEQEIELLSQFEHENIVRYLGTDKADSKHYIFLELVTQGSLASLYKKYRLLDSQVSAYTKQILMGLKYLHDRNVVHRDIKCANILVASNGTVKLADFGLAKATRLNDLMSFKGTPFWMAPEVVCRENQGYGLAADIWSLGCTVLEMLTCHYPYHPLPFQQALFKIAKGKLPPIPDSLSADAQDFILQCLHVNADNRPTAAELLDHQFLH